MLSSGTQRDYVQTAECGCNVSAWEIYDDMLKATADQEDDVLFVSMNLISLFFISVLLTEICCVKRKRETIVLN